MAGSSISLMPFELQVLVASVLDVDNLSSESGSRRVVRCVQAFETEIYVGCHDGSLLRFVLPELEGSLAESYILLGRSSTPNGKPAEEIHVLPSVGRVLVLSERRIHFFSYPTLDHIPTDAPLKNAISMCIDEQAYPVIPSTVGARQKQVPPIEVCVVKNASVTIYAIREKVAFRKDIPLPPDVRSPQTARRTGRYLCLADSDNYNMIDLEEGMFLPCIPLSQAPDVAPPPPPHSPTSPSTRTPPPPPPLSPSPKVIPSISVVGDGVFLILSWNGYSTMGVFIKGTGDPAGGLLEYPGRVSSICIGASNVVALFSDNTIQIHSLDKQELIQTLHPSPRYQIPISLVSNKTGTVGPLLQRQARLQRVDFSLPLPEVSPSLDPNFIAPHTRPPSRRKDAPSHHKVITIKSRVMICSANALYFLVPRSLISRAEELIEAHKIEECAALLPTGTPTDPNEVEELRYLQQRLGYRCFTSTLFEEAGTWLFRGELDPRILISHFPDLVGAILSSSPSIRVFSALREHIPTTSVDDLILENLVRNYSPHLAPNTRSAPPTAELRKILNQEARKMLGEYLRKCITRRQYEEANEESPFVYAVVDTVFARLLAEKEQTQDLEALVQKSSSIYLPDVEGTFIRYGQYYSLCILYEKAGAVHKLVEAWTKIVDEKWTEPRIPDPLNRIFQELSGTKDQELLMRWRVWFIERDLVRGMELITSHELSSKSSSRSEDHTLLEQLQRHNATAAHQYLEYLILQKGDRDPELHTLLATRLIQRLDTLLQNQALADSVMQIYEKYRMQTSQEPFFITVTASPPDYKLSKLKALLFLQSSAHYIASSISEALQSSDNAHSFSLEQVIVNSRLGLHDEALSILIRDLKDFVSAELYCARAGDVIPSKTVEDLILNEQEKEQLKPWLAFFTLKSRRRNAKASASQASEQVALVNKLLKVYLNDSSPSRSHVSRLLDTQAPNLEPEEVLPMIPSDWPVAEVAPFLSRHLRDRTHKRRQLDIIKALSLGRNYEIAEQAWFRLRAEGFMVEEPDSDGGSVYQEPTENEKVIADINSEKPPVVVEEITGVVPPEKQMQATP